MDQPKANVMEHFTDGDLFNGAQAPGLAPLASLLDVQWGGRLAVGGGGS